ncbi:2-oxo acid dehydrogenase subunit E2 [Mycobacterium montefiorense]|nr:2-oxo acid dehydrogenase subunit E2 [Mycobacterium montefiorense]
MNAAITAVPVRRRHTLAFLRGIRSAAPVHLSTEVDVSALVDRRETASRRYSYVTHVVAALGETLRRHPDANVAFGGSWLMPRIIWYESVNVKLTLDKTDRSVRHVASAVLPDVASLDLNRVQDMIDRLRNTPAADLDDLAGSRLLDRLPPALGCLAFALATRLSKRSAVLGTVALTNLGHADVAAFHSHGGTAITIGLGAVRHRPVCVPGTAGEYVLAARPTMPLNLTFDHRALDGAMAAEVLTALAGILHAGGTCDQ